MMMNDDQTAVKGNPLGYAPIMGLIQKFAIPSIISMLVNAAYNITDQIFIGHVVGMLGNAATNVAFPVVTFTIAFAQLCLMTAAPRIQLSRLRPNRAPEPCCGCHAEAGVCFP